MPKLTTADCKKFLVDFFTSTPDLIVGIYESSVGHAALKSALVASKWKRRSKCTPGGIDSALSGDHYEVFEKGKDYPKGPNYYAGAPIPSVQVLCERVFVLDEDTYDTAIAFLVIETKEGQLFLGEYVGD